MSLNLKVDTDHRNTGLFSTYECVTGGTDTVPLHCSDALVSVMQPFQLDLMPEEDQDA